MNKLYFLAIAVGISFYTRAQNPIPNAGFEQWTNSTTLTGWTNSQFITQTTPGHSGTYAVKGEKTTYAPHLSAGSGSGFPCTVRYDYLNLYYKFNQLDSEFVTISVTVKDANNAGIGFGSGYITASASGFTALSIPIYYTGSAAAATCTIDAFISAPGGIPPTGSYFIFDDFELSGTTTGINNVAANSFSLFPNPAANLVNVQLKNNSAPAQITLCNALGQQLKSLQSNGANIQLNTADLPAGLYTVTILQQGLAETKKLLVVR